MENKVNTKEDIIKHILENSEQLSALGVASLGLFGSFARGDQDFRSDVDILIEFTHGKHTFDNFMEVSFLLEEILGRKVEIVTPESLSPHIGTYISKEIEHVPIAA